METKRKIQKRIFAILLTCVMLVSFCGFAEQSTDMNALHAALHAAGSHDNTGRGFRRSGGSI